MNTRVAGIVFLDPFLYFFRELYGKPRIMKFIAVAFCLTLVLAVAGFVAVAFIDVPVAQTEITKTVPNDQFYNSNSGGTQ